MSPIPPELVLALLYAGPGAVIRRGSDGVLEVVPAARASDGQVLYSQEQLLADGIAGLGLVA